MRSGHFGDFFGHFGAITGGPGVMDGGCTTPGGDGVGQVMRTLQVTDSGDYSLFFLYKGRLSEIIFRK